MASSDDLIQLIDLIEPIFVKLYRSRQCHFIMNFVGALQDAYSLNYFCRPIETKNCPVMKIFRNYRRTVGHFQYKSRSVQWIKANHWTRCPVLFSASITAIRQIKRANSGKLERWNLTCLLAEMTVNTMVLDL